MGSCRARRVHLYIAKLFLKGIFGADMTSSQVFPIRLILSQYESNYSDLSAEFLHFIYPVIFSAI